MKIRNFLIVVSLLGGSLAFAQKKQFTMAEATNGMATTLATKGVKNVSWQTGTNNLWYTEKKDQDFIFKVLDVETGKTTDMAPGTLPDGITAAGGPTLKWLNKYEAYFIEDQTVVKGHLENNRFTWTKEAVLPENAENIFFDKSGKTAYTVGNNVWMNIPGKGNVQISYGNDGIVNGKSVHRDEFGIDHGIFFSPKGTYLAYYRMDQNMVRNYPIIHWDETPAKNELIKYPMAGGPSHEVTLCVYDPFGGKTIGMETGMYQRDHYLTSVTWSPNEKSIYIAILNRGQDHLELNQYDAQTGQKLKTLFEEKNSKYVHPTHPLTFLKGDDDHFIWWSERDGYQHLYYYNTNGSLERQLTKGEWVVNDICGYNQDKKELIITASKESPLEKHIYSVNVKTGKITRLDKEPGMHMVSCSEDGKYLVDVYSNEQTPKNTVLRSIDGKKNTELLKSPDPLEDYDRAIVRNIKIKAADDETDLYAKMILPPDFDSTRKYPVIVYLYNGPNVQLLHNSYPASGNLWYEYMAQHGYIVFTLDGRGSWNRGLAFEQATYRQLGEVEMDDQIKGVEYLRGLSYVDTSKMGVHGWSFGGFMTTSLMLKYPGVFKCAVAGGPVIDWRMYEVMYTERYMDTPVENPDGYDRASLLDKVKNLKGKLMLIHGTNDDVVVWQHSLSFIKKCVDEGVQVDYFVYPGHLHNVRGKDRVHLMQKITNYFDDYLKR